MNEDVIALVWHPGKSGEGVVPEGDVQLLSTKEVMCVSDTHD